MPSARTSLPRFRHRRYIRLLPVVYRHATVSRRDVFLVSYPKSGNTWLRFMLTFLLSGREADFDEDSTVIAPVGAHLGTPRVLSGSGRIIKSHEPYSEPQRRFYRRAIYLVRDGRDVAVSYYHMLIRRGLYKGHFSSFLKVFLGPGVDGYGSWRDHVESWLDSPLSQRGSLFVLKYEDLLERPVECLSAVMESLGVPVDRARVEEAVRRHSAERMRARERASQFHLKQKRSDIMFVRKADSGDWSETFSPADAELFDRVAGGLLRRLGYA